MELDGAPLLSDASIRDFMQGTAGYVANAVEQSLLLPKDMADFKSIRQYEVFLGLKKDLAMVSLLSFFFSFLFYIIITFILLLYNFFKCTSRPFQAIQATFKAKEMVNYSHREMKKK